MTDDRRQLLLRAKLTALVKDGWGDAPVDVVPFPGGLAARRGATGWVLAEERPDRALGAALAWGRRSGIDELHLLPSGAAGVLARQAAAFSADIRVWEVEGRDRRPAVPAPLPDAAPPDPRVLAFAPLLTRAGARPWVEHDGTLVGEVLGLEVARAVHENGEVHLEAGVGKHDREVQRLLLGDEPTAEALAVVVEEVRRHRSDPSGIHPLSQLVPERWLAEVVALRPDLVGERELERRPALVLRDDLRDRAPAPVVGHGVVVMCSVGLDPELVPQAADARLAYASPSSRLVLVVPEGDDHSATRGLADALVEPAEVVTVRRDWRSLLVE